MVPEHFLRLIQHGIGLIPDTSVGIDASLVAVVKEASFDEVLYQM